MSEIHVTIHRDEDANPGVEPGWYAIWPEGGGIVAVRVNACGEVVDQFEHGVWLETFRRSHDRRLWVAEAIEAERTDSDLDMIQADAIVTAWDASVDPYCCTVERVIEDAAE